MLISNSVRNGSIQSAINYFFSDKNHQGEKRPFKPVLLKGDIDSSIAIGKLTEKFSIQTVSGTIAFAKNENLNREQMLSCIDRFENLHGNMKERVNAIYVLHEEEKSFHIHYAIPKIDILTGKYYNPFPPGQMTVDMMKAFSAVENHNFGFEQVKPKSNFKTHFTKSERKYRKLTGEEEYKKGSNTNSGYTEISNIINDKVNFDIACRNLIKTGEVKNRNELIEFLQENGYKLSRISDKFISIENKEGKNFRLKGDIYEDTGKNYSVIVEEKRNEVKNFNPLKVEQQLNRIIELRNIYNEKRYKAKPEKPSFKARQEQQQKQATSPLQTRDKSLQAPSSKPIDDIQQGNPSDSCNSSQSTDDSTGRTTTDTGSIVSTAGAIGAQSSLDKAISQLANAKTPEQAAKAQVQVAIASNALNNALAQIEEQKKQQLNRRKI